jgi:hypothetical protein
MEGQLGKRVLKVEKFFWTKNTNLAQGLRLKKSAHFLKGILRLLVEFTVWMMRTHFISSNNEALKDYEAMKGELDRILNLVPTIEKASDDNMLYVTDEISKFVDEFV